MTEGSRPGRAGNGRSPARIDDTTEPATPTFGPDVAPHHRRLDRSAWENVYVVGDVHGCYDRLQALLDTLDVGARDLLVFVGDLVRKGPDSARVVAFVRDHENAVSVRGNNEDKLIDGRAHEPGLTEADLAFCRSLPVAISFGDALVVHGGIDTRKSLAEQRVDDLLTTRAIPPENGYDGPFWFDAYEGSPRVFFGHTVLDAPLVTEEAVGLDTGCVYGGALTAYDYNAGETVCVPGHEHQHRADDAILTP